MVMVGHTMLGWFGYLMLFVVNFSFPFSLFSILRERQCLANFIRGVTLHLAGGRAGGAFAALCRSA